MTYNYPPPDQRSQYSQGSNGSQGYGGPSMPSSSHPGHGVDFTTPYYGNVTPPGGQSHHVQRTQTEMYPPAPEQERTHDYYAWQSHQARSHWSRAIDAGSQAADYAAGVGGVGGAISGLAQQPIAQATMNSIGAAGGLKDAYTSAADMNAFGTQGPRRLSQEGDSTFVVGARKAATAVAAASSIASGGLSIAGEYTKNDTLKMAGGVAGLAKPALSTVLKVGPTHYDMVRDEKFLRENWDKFPRSAQDTMNTFYTERNRKAVEKLKKKDPQTAIELGYMGGQPSGAGDSHGQSGRHGKKKQKNVVAPGSAR
ncbi:hypothetical protein Val02_50810 [Virgisporangium aliadipatigenens]|uniref:Uncharacterized protein n=1 Tax=Virgisporangium aliadipatigenens TaxID=741659 RepID=A0A8J3YQL0_9ACTN|nr:hypothetical protein [Virgisporangium aliadipatigenens]GIJ48195.1 hypothetical protein Val02_50810 [Virgisporangium aliadipatigenens]